jgi:hypothetical protein
MHRRILILSLVLVIIASISGCDIVGSDQIEADEGATDTANGLELTITEILRGDESVRFMKQKGADAEPEVGWDLVIVRFAATNVTEEAIVSPYRLCGAIMDSGGYEREATFIEGHPKGEIPQAPGFTSHSLAFATYVPQNQELVSLEMQPANYAQPPAAPCSRQYGVPWSFDLQAPIVELDTSNIFSGVNRDGVLEHTVSGNYSIQVSNFHFEPTDSTYDLDSFLKGAFSLVATVTVENLGGDNLCFAGNRPWVLVTDDQGDSYLADIYFMEDQENMTSRGCLPPGFVTTADIHLNNDDLGYFDYDTYRSKTLHLSLLTRQQGTPVSETLVDVPEDVPERFNPYRETVDDVDVSDDYDPWSKETIRVGTSADYEPFEYVDSQGNIVGFDVDLMEEMADRMDTEVVWEDITFDYLFESLNAGEVDVVIAALSITSEREELVRFTHPYFVGGDEEEAMAIAVRHKDTELLKELNFLITELRESGFIGQLADEYSLR